MGKNSKIEWCTHSANLWKGCVKINEGCENCYAEAWSNRWGEDIWGNDKPRMAVKSIWGNFLSWQAKAEALNERHRVFVGSLMDIFEKPMHLIDHKGNKLEETTDDLRQRFFNEIVPNCPNLIFLLLTKRPSNINKYIPENWKDNPPGNVMFGASVVNDKTMMDVCRHMSKVNGKQFWSVEPLLEEISIENLQREQMPDWLIVGGESGKNKRPFDPEWGEVLLNDCKHFGIPFFYKQIDKVVPIPEKMLVREFPAYHNELNHA